MIEITELNVYPIKGCRGTSLQSMELDARGPALDRRFMIVDASGEFVTQREEPRLTLLEPTWLAKSLELRAPGMPDLSIPLQAAGHGSMKRTEVRVWRFQGEALLVSEEADAGLSEWLGFPCRLVGCAPDMKRDSSPEWTKGPVPIGFPDGYPVLLISEASLEALNTAVHARDPQAEALTMARFRPNIVVRGCEAFAEDDWVRIRIGDVELEIVKPCDRCRVTTVDPETGERGKEPLQTLARMRKSEQGVLFGQNCVPQGTGILHVGHEVQVLAAGGLKKLPEAWRVSSTLG
ncbi:MAG: MOSC N-terminal beta barrel domain-containing protein [Myxococcota bacterium]|nr:MOSC N-terminal beta barrel domain-containing protein [Myxococcota bacterium]